jgi:hypothetical protein
MESLDCINLAAFRGPTELKVNHSQQTGGFFCLSSPYIGGFSSFFGD